MNYSNIYPIHTKPAYRLPDADAMARVMRACKDDPAVKVMGAPVDTSRHVIHHPVFYPPRVTYVLAKTAKTGTAKGRGA